MTKDMKNTTNYCKNPKFKKVPLQTTLFAPKKRKPENAKVQKLERTDITKVPVGKQQNRNKSNAFFSL
jgi:hypothetical protein